MRKRYLNPDQVETFQRDGVLVIRDFYGDADILPIQHGIHAIIGQIMSRHGITDQRVPFSPANFDEGYLDLIKQNRKWGGEVYDAIKQIPAFVRLVAHPAHEIVMSELRKNAQSGLAAGGYGIRIDNPFEDKFRAMWHQEYPAQLRSMDGLVFWSPLIPITDELGPVVFCQGSHKEGPLQVCNADPENAGRSGAYALKIKDEEIVLAKYRKLAPLTNPRDLVIIDFLVLHASGFNRSNRSRWSMQFRYFNFSDPVGRAHGWSGSYAAGIDFRAIHPELYVA
jgi:hypothetical protein